jgi:anti-sigma regulatory factor (Ser/Thr protein kinase)
MIRAWKLEKGDYAGAHRAHGELRTLLSERGLAEEDVATCELVFGELVTNALKYGQEPVAAGATISDSLVHLEIEDSGQCFCLKEDLEVPLDSTRGRGLLLSSALTGSLNVEKTSGRCRVTATLPVHFENPEKSDASVG